jgi:Flp pilus assembly protein TadG
MFTRITALAREIRDSREGAVAIHMALIFIPMLGMVGLATDIGFVLDKHRQMQLGADVAAYSATIAKSTNNPTVTTQANAVAGQAGFVNGANSVTITVNNPPVSPPANATDAADPTAVQVIITQPQTLPLVSLLYSGAFTLSVQAVATAGAGGACAWQLSSSANPGVTISNGATVNLKQCGLTTCSTGNTALSMSGGTHLNITDKSGNLSSSFPVSVAGGASVTNGAQINNVGSCTAPTCKTSQGACAATADPYNSVAMPTPPTTCGTGFTNNKQYAHGTWSLKPSDGMYCNGVQFTNDAIVTMAPGVYFIKGGTFNRQRATDRHGRHDCPDRHRQRANVDIGNGANVTLSAPQPTSSLATQGIVFFGDRSAPASTTSNCTGNGASTCFEGGASMNITGAIYFPTQTVQFNNGISNPSGCTQLIAGIIQFNGGANFSNNCAGTGTSGSGGVPTLVE